ncbi:MAG: hypothetical protein LQ342_003346 [Letrouitia transgressa]|nr:MAG: hypothetical protein LQ342_003346 [Letrouitia transgressa]
MRCSFFALPLFVFPFASAGWTIDFYQKDSDCKADDSGNPTKPPDYAGTKTLTGDDGIDCDGGAVYKDGGKDSNAITIKGINDSEIVVHIFTNEGCSEDSYIGTAHEDGCYVNGDLGEGSLNYVLVENRFVLKGAVP